MVAMAVWPTDGADGSVANEARWRKMGRVMAADGVVAGISYEMTPSLAFPNLTVQAGAVWIDGHYAEIGSDQTLTATANGLAVVRFDPAANAAELLWRDGATTLTQDHHGIWEIAIAKTVGSVLTDLRIFSSPATPLKTFMIDNVVDVIIPTGGDNDMIPVGSFTMPFTGSFVFQGSLKVANSTAGLLSANPIEISATSVPAATARPPSTWRTEAAPGAGQSIIHVPLIGSWAKVTGGTVCTIRAHAIAAGAVGLQVVRASGIVYATRI
jgi:hypothetical protein